MRPYIQIVLLLIDYNFVPKYSDTANMTILRIWLDYSCVSNITTFCLL